MRLRTQVGTMLIAVFGCLVAVSTIVQLRVIYPSFERLEASLASTDADRCVQAINREVEYVSKFAMDWSMWDDMYRFSQDNNQAFLESNLASREYFQKLNVPVMLICDSQGKVVYGHALDLATLKPVSLALFPPDQLPADHPLLRPSAEDELRGVILTERGPLLVASRVILHSDQSGPPVGRFIVGRFIDDEAIAQFCEQTSVRFNVWSTRDALPADVAPQLAALLEHPGEQVMESASASILNVFRLIPTLVSGESLVLRAAVPREITMQGAASIGFGLISLLVAAGCIVLGLITLLQRRVVEPIVTLKNHATSVASSGDLTARLTSTRKDEVGALAGEFDRMIGRLADSQASLALASRQAGMAEVASGVLHNVGNAMTNATVTVSQLQRGLEQSCAGGLAKAATLLQDHQHDLAAFLTSDERGRQIPAYLARLAGSIGAEQRGLADDVRRLQASLDHINEIIRAQQGLAVAPDVLEVTRIAHVIAQTTLLVRSSFERHQVELRTRIPDDIAVQVDRSRLQQVLMNMLTNALQAVKPTEALEDRLVEIAAGVDAPGRFWIEVRDRGIGFDPDKRRRLFAQGFTTRDGGHGLGLHFCAVAIKHMGGEISAASDGPGRGATFRIDLPTSLPARVHAAAPALVEARAAA